MPKIYLSDWLEFKGISQLELARRADLYPSQVSKIASGQTEPRPTTLRKIASALGVEHSMLFVSPTKWYEAEIMKGSTPIPTKPADIDAWFNDPNATVNGRIATPEMKDVVRRMIELVLKERI